MEDLIQLLAGWLFQFGGPILFFMLVLGIVGLPIPDETLLTLTGWLMASGKLAIVSTAIFAITGSICGITLSYWLGRSTGSWFLKRYGSKLRITETRLQRVNNWYHRFGKWILLVGYFIPVVRHLAGYVSGSFNLSIREFMIFAYIGALIWSITFLCLGYFLLIEVFPLKF